MTRGKLTAGAVECSGPVKAILEVKGALDMSWDIIVAPSKREAGEWPCCDGVAVGLLRSTASCVKVPGHVRPTLCAPGGDVTTVVVKDEKLDERAVRRLPAVAPHPPSSSGTPRLSPSRLSLCAVCLPLNRHLRLAASLPSDLLGEA